MEPSFPGAQPPRRRSGGCLWGCLAVVLVVLLVVGGLFGFSAWFLHRNIENDSRLQTIMAIVRDDPRAQAILGRDIRIESVDSRTFAMGTGIGKTASYTLRLAGSRGEGTLEVSLDLDHAQPKVTSMVLTGSDGHPYYLVGKEPENLLKQSI
jgi:hypothetical protein